MSGAFGRQTLPSGRIVSARLNPGVEFIQDTTVDADISDAELSDIDGMLATAGASTGGKRRQRGGAMTRAEKLKYAKAIAMMVVYNAAWGLGAGGRAAAPIVKEYIMTRIITPIYGVSSPTVTIMGKLADQVIQSGVTVVKVGIAGTGYTANVIGKIIQKFNAWGTSTSALLLDDAYAQTAADNAVATVNGQIGAGGVGLLVLNQLGVLPLSALLAGILFAVRANFGNGPGRAYVAASFYTWFVNRPPEDRDAMAKAAKEYAAAAASGATEAAATAAATLGPLLARGVGSGAGAVANAYAAIAGDVRALGNGASANDSAPRSLGVEDAVSSAGTAATVPSVVAAAAETVLVTEGLASPPSSSSSSSSSSASSPLSAPPSFSPLLLPSTTTTTLGPGAMGGPGSAVAAFTTGKAVPRARAPPKTKGTKRAPEEEEEEEGGISTGEELAPPSAVKRRKGGSTGGRKTKKRAAKRRMTRRRKAPKYLAAPVFGRKGATFAY